MQKTLSGHHFIFQVQEDDANKLDPKKTANILSSIIEDVKSRADLISLKNRIFYLLVVHSRPQSDIRISCFIRSSVSIDYSSVYDFRVLGMKTIIKLATSEDFLALTRELEPGIYVVNSNIPSNYCTNLGGQNPLDVKIWQEARGKIMSELTSKAPVLNLEPDSLNKARPSNSFEDSLNQSQIYKKLKTQVDTIIEVLTANNLSNIIPTNLVQMDSTFKINKKSEYKLTEG